MRLHAAALPHPPMPHDHVALLHVCTPTSRDAVADVCVWVWRDVRSFVFFSTLGVAPYSLGILYTCICASYSNEYLRLKRQEVDVKATFEINKSLCCGLPPWLVVPVLRSCQSPIWIWLVNYLHLHLHYVQVLRLLPPSGMALPLQVLCAKNRITSASL